MSRGCRTRCEYLAANGDQRFRELIIAEHGLDRRVMACSQHFGSTSRAFCRLLPGQIRIDSAARSRTEADARKRMQARLRSSTSQPMQNPYVVPRAMRRKARRPTGKAVFNKRLATIYGPVLHAVKGAVTTKGRIVYSKYSEEPKLDEFAVCRTHCRNLRDPSGCGFRWGGYHPYRTRPRALLLIKGCVWSILMQ